MTSITPRSPPPISIGMAVRIPPRIITIAYFVALALLASPSAGVASPTETTAQPRLFDDVPQSNNFYEEINWLGDSGISRGWALDDGRFLFNPSHNISREAMAAFIFRLAELEGHDSVEDYTPPSSSHFPDVSTSHVFYKEISWLAQQRITTGYDDGRFKPLDRISREAVAAFIYRYQDKKGQLGNEAPPSTPLYSDVPKNHAFYKEITWATMNGIATGYEEDYGCYAFKPRKKTTREAMAAFIYRIPHGGVKPISPDCSPPPKPTRPTKQALFTYGTLMKGQPAAHYLNGTYKSYSRSSFSGADLYYSASRNFPYLVVGGKHSVQGEVYNLHDSTASATITRTDAYERYNPNKPDDGQAYVRKQYEIQQGYTAWVYVAGPQQAAWLKSNGTRIPSGDWLRR